MNASSRQSLINKTYRVLKKHYQPVTPPADRPVLEHLLYACCLENAKHESVDEVFAKLEQNYFDWNEVRVTTVAELAEVMSGLPDAAEAARRLKRTLQGVFESQYSFDLEALRKQNLGKAVQDLEKYNGVTAFAVAYVTQNALGGHSIPVNAGVFAALQVLGVISAAEAAKKRVPGMERAIPKSKGVEFGSLLHQFGVDYATATHSTRLRGIILEIDPDAKERLPRRGAKKDAAQEAGGGKKQARAAGKKTAAGKRRQPSEGKGKGKAKGKAKSPPTTGSAASANANGERKSQQKSAGKRLSRRKPR
jgi:endonuclease-3